MECNMRGVGFQYGSWARRRLFRVGKGFPEKGLSNARRKSWKDKGGKAAVRKFAHEQSGKKPM